MNPEHDPRDLGAIMREALDALSNPGAAPMISDAIPTGIAALDEILGGGLRRGTVNQLTGRGSTGKTCLALQAVRASAIDNAIPTLHVTFEEGRDGITQRLIAATCSVRKDHLYRPERLTDEGRAALIPERLKAVADSPLRVADDVDTLGDIEREAGKYDGVQLITIDSAIALVHGVTGSASEEYDELGLRLRTLARETGAAVLIVTHIPSADPERARRVPANADRRAVASLDSVCDTVLLLHLPDDDHRQPWRDDTLAEIHVIKRRNGRTGTTSAIFERAYGRFRSLTDAEEADPWTF